MFQVVETPQEMYDLEVFSGIGMRRFKFFHNQTMPGHTHNYGHPSMVVRGSMHYRLEYPDGKVVEQTIKAPGVIDVPAECFHEMRALTEEAEVWCVFVARDAEGEIAEFAQKFRNGAVPYWSA